MARKEMYTLKVDGRVVWTSNPAPVHEEDRKRNA